MNLQDFTEHILDITAVCVTPPFMIPASTAKTSFLKASVCVWSLQIGPAAHSPDTWVRYEERMLQRKYLQCVLTC